MGVPKNILGPQNTPKNVFFGKKKMEKIIFLKKKRLPRFDWTLGVVPPVAWVNWVPSDPLTHFKN